MSAATSITVGTWQGFLGRGLALRELECVLGLALGKTSKQLAQDMGIEAESVKKACSPLLQNWVCDFGPSW